MSRIFEAMQKSGMDRFGDALPDFPGASALLEAAEREEKRSVATAVAPIMAPAMPPVAVPNPIELPVPPVLTVNLPKDSRLISITDKESLGAEKFRFLGVRLRQVQQARQLKRILISSTVPEEGKSFVSANLAITLARRQQQKVLLIDGDLRRPTLGQLLGYPKLAGLSEWLQGELRPMNGIYQLQGPGFWFLPAGRPPDNPLELLQTERLHQLLDQLSTRFDWVVIDSPPILPLADTSVWAKLAQGVLLVVREGKTEKRQLERSIKAIEAANLLGVVVNGCTTTDNTNYYSRYSPQALAAQANNS